MKRPYCISLWICMLIHCVVNSLTAQNFNTLKKSPAAIFDETLSTLLNNDDASGMASYLLSNPQMVNGASSTKSERGYGSKPIVRTVPLLYDAVYRSLHGYCSVEICKIIINAGCDINAVFEERTPIYLILDYLATHPIDQCKTAETLLELFLTRKDFDVNYRYKSLLPPLSHLIRTNRLFLGKFDKDYISEHTLKLLIENGSPINTYDNDGNSLMKFAIETDNQYLSLYFIQNGIDLYRENKSGNDAMFQAIDAGQIEIIKQLLQQGYELNIHNLANEPATFKKYPEIYDYLTEMLGGQVSSYEDIKLFIKKFNDKFSLVQKKLHAIYQNEYALVEASRQYFISLNPNKNNAENIAKSIYLKKDFFDSAKMFAIRHAGYDPDHIVPNAQEIMDIYTICEGLSQLIPATYIDYPSNWITASLREDLFGNDLFIDKKSAFFHDDIMKKALAISNQLGTNNSFQLLDFFTESSNILTEKLIQLNEIWEKDKTVYNQHLKEAKARYQVKMCANCELDKDKSKLPQMKEPTFWNAYTDQDPGKLVMKNGKTQDFYWDSSSRKWYTSNGFIFPTKNEFDNPQDLYDMFCKECIMQWCKE